MCEVLRNHYLANTYDIPRSFSLLSIHDADDDSKHHRFYPCFHDLTANSGYDDDEIHSPIMVLEGARI